MQTLHKDIVNIGGIADFVSGRKLKITSKMSVGVVFQKAVKEGKSGLAYLLKKYLVYFLYVIDALKKRYKALAFKICRNERLLRYALNRRAFRI